MNQIKSSIWSLQEILLRNAEWKDDKKDILIPNFQRGYVWSEAQISNLWNDILDLYVKLQVGTNSNAQIFMGAITLSNGHLLLDGQQRLTTLCVLLDVLIDNDGCDPYKVRKGYIRNEVDRLDVLSKSSKNIDIETRFNKANNLQGAEAYVAKYKSFVKRIFDSENPLDIHKLYEIVCNRLFFAVHIIEGNEHIIFEKINSTGKKLSRADLLHNYLIEVTSDKNELMDVQKKWVELSNILSDSARDEKRIIDWIRADDGLSKEEEDQLKTFLESESIATVSDALWEKFYHAMYSFECVEYHTMPQTISPLKTFLSGKGTAKEQIRYIIAMAKLYINATNPSMYYRKEKASVYLESLYLFSQIADSTFIPMAMRLLARKHDFLKEDSVFATRIDAIFKSIVQCWLLLRLCPERNDKTRLYFFSMAQKIDYSIQAYFAAGEKFSTELVITLLLGSEGYEDLKDRFNNDFDSALRNHEYNSKISKMLLTIYSNALEPDGSKIHQLEAKEKCFYQVEHIVPKTPKSEFTIENYGLNPSTVHQLGNLILLEDNINNNIGNDSPEDKANGYKESKLKKTFEVLSIPKKSTDNSQSREARLRKIISTVKEYCKLAGLVKLGKKKIIIGHELLQYGRVIALGEHGINTLDKYLELHGNKKQFEKMVRSGKVVCKTYFSDNTYEPKDKEKNQNSVKQFYIKDLPPKKHDSFQAIMASYLEAYCEDKGIDDIVPLLQTAYSNKVNNSKKSSVDKGEIVAYDPFKLSPTKLYRSFKQERRNKEENIFCIKNRNWIKKRSGIIKDDCKTCDHKSYSECDFAVSFSGGYLLEAYIKGFQSIMKILKYTPGLYLEMENPEVVAVGSCVTMSNLINIGNKEAYTNAVKKQHEIMVQHLSSEVENKIDANLKVNNLEKVDPSFETTQVSLVSLLLDSRNVFKIPVYQREYVWDEINFDLLVKDLSEGREYIGTVIMGKAEEHEYIVIDGQQRITTIAVLLCELGFEVANIITYDKTSILYGLNRAETDCSGEFMVTHKDMSVAVEMARRSKAWQYFSKFTSDGSKWLENFDADNLTEFINKLSSVCMITIKDNIEEYQYAVFESINGKGMPLKTEDLIRNFLYQEEFSKEYNQDKIIDAICYDKEDYTAMRFITAYVEMVQEEDVSSNDLFDRFKECYKNEKFRNELINAHKVFDEIVRVPEKIVWLDNSDLNRHIRKNLLLYRQLGNTTADALILSYSLHAIKEKKIEAYKELDEVLDRVLGLYFVMNTRNAENDKKSINAKLPQYSYTFDGSKKDISELSCKNVVQSFHYKDENEGYKKVLDGLFEQTWYDGSGKVTAFILMKIEEWLGLNLDKELELLQKKKYNIEHICPVDLKKHNFKDLGSGEKSVDYFIKPTRQSGIENLCLLEEDKNKKIGNDIFANKKEIYKKSDFFVPKILADKFSHKQYYDKTAADEWYGELKDRLLKSNIFKEKMLKIIKRE